jgi:hypothetical protein
MKIDAPKISAVSIVKVNRFWNLSVNGKLLAIVLYKRGAESVQQLIQQLAGLPVTIPEDDEKKQAGLPRQAKQPAVKNADKANKTPAAKPPTITAKETQVAAPAAKTS